MVPETANHGNVMLEGPGDQQGRLVQVLILQGGRIDRLAVHPSFGRSCLGSAGDGPCERSWSLNHNEPANLAVDRLIDDALEIG